MPDMTPLTAVRILRHYLANQEPLAYLGPNSVWKVCLECGAAIYHQAKREERRPHDPSCSYRQAMEATERLLYFHAINIEYSVTDRGELCDTIISIE